MNIQLRRAIVNDAPMLSALAVKTFYDTFKDTCTEDDIQGLMADFFNVDAFTKELSDEKDYCYVAEVDGVAAGYIRFKEDQTAFPEINKWKSIELKRLYVLDAFHGKGIAQQLMDTFLHFVQEHNYEAAFLGVWEHNLKAQKFYEKYGFKNSGYTHDFPIGNTPQTDCWYWKFFNE